MKNKFIRFNALTLCILCLVSMILPIYAASNCSKCGDILPSVSCNNGYLYTHYYHNDSSVWCYATWNARCEQRCTSCGQNHFVDHWHTGLSRTQHIFIIEETLGGTYQACDRAGCYYSKLISK